MNRNDNRLRNMTALYLSRNGKMLLLYRVGSRVVEPSWVGIGGHFENEELNSPQTCVLRELSEEAGLCSEDLENLRMRYVTLRLKNGEVRQNYYFFANLKEGAEPLCCSDEGKLRWIAEEEVLSLKMPLTARQMLTHYMETGRSNDRLYGGITCENGMVFTELKEF